MDYDWIDIQRAMTQDREKNEHGSSVQLLSTTVLDTFHVSTIHYKTEVSWEYEIVVYTRNGPGGRNYIYQERLESLDEHWKIVEQLMFNGTMDGYKED